jgi:hypothetical protein
MMNEQMTLFNYWQELWREAAPKTKQALRITAIVYLGCFLLLGSYLAATQMAAIAPMKTRWQSVCGGWRWAVWCRLAAVDLARCAGGRPA